MGRSSPPPARVDGVYFWVDGVYFWKVARSLNSTMMNQIVMEVGSSRHDHPTRALGIVASSTTAAIADRKLATCQPSSVVS